MKTNLIHCLFKTIIFSSFWGLIFGVVSLKANPVVKQYNISDLTTLQTDLNAGNADIYELTESGDYIITSTQHTFATLGKSVTIRAASGLINRPVFKYDAASTGTGTRFFYTNTPDISITFEGIEFDGYNAGASIQPIFLTAETGSSNLQITINNCYFQRFANTLSGYNSIIVMRGSMTSLEIQDSHVNNSIGKLFYFNSTTESDAPSVGNLILKNNIFSNINDATTYVFFYQANSPTNQAKGNDLKVDHCTFYNISPNRTFTTRKFYGVAEFKNSIFVNVAERGFNISPVTIDYCYLAGIAQYSSSIPSGTRTNEFASTPVPTFADASNLDFTLTNGSSFVCGDTFVAGFNKVRLTTPVVGDASGITTAGFTANWTPVDNAQGYKVEVYQGVNLIDICDAPGQSSNYLHITGLSNYTEYTYKIQAVGDIYYANSFISESSDPFQTGPTTSLERHVKSIKLVCNGGKTIASTTTGNFIIYNIQGTKLIQAQNTDIVNTDLPFGLYLVEFMNKDGEKIIEKIIIR
ncbi:MAG: hypothetical protein RBR74_12220 [Ignavibacteriaceae bacterium]|jgi:hypothetical protein|nr:hypothetical protein [Ignavibacteriaceae bacterium]